MAGEIAEIDEQSWLYRPSFPDEWERMPLLSMARWVNGLAFRDFQFSDTGKPVIKIAEIKAGITGQTKFTNQTFDDSVFVTNGDMLFSWSGQPETSIDVFWWRGRDGWLNQHIFKVTPIEDLDPDFFFYVLRYLKPNFIGIARNKQTTGLGHVTRRDIENIEAAFPPLAEQKAIAAVLGALDDKIELNRRMNATLEAMARALFQSWFVDFDPVRAKLDGRQPAALDPATAALFPDSLEDSPLGHIPKGWKAGTVAEGFNLTMGQSPPGETYNEKGDGLPFYQGRTDFGFRFPTRRIHCTAPTRYAKPGDTLVSVRAPVGDINMVNEECCIGRGVAAVRHKSGATSFTYHSMAHLHPDFARFEAEGTVFGSINKDSFENLRFVIPPDEIVAAYERQAGPLDEQIRILENQTRTLATLRDTLLPKLLSGEISVPAAEQEVVPFA